METEKQLLKQEDNRTNQKLKPQDNLVWHNHQYFNNQIKFKQQMKDVNEIDRII